MTNPTVETVDRSRPELREAFSGRNRVARMKGSEANLVRFLRSGEGDPAAVAELVALAKDWRLLHCGPFDHGELWGRDREVLHLIGQPYAVSNEDLALLATFHDAGFWVCISDLSWYGWGTLRVHVSHPYKPALARKLESFTADAQD